MEDAEHGNTKRWEVWDNDPPGTPHNAVDPDDRENRVIQVSNFDTGYRLNDDPKEPPNGSN